MTVLLEDMRTRWDELDRHIATDSELATMVCKDDRARRLADVPSIGALNATARVTAVIDARNFGRGRDLAAWLCLAPWQVMTGDRPKLLEIMKCGSKYLRKMRIQRARTAMPVLRRADNAAGAWLRGLLGRAHAHAHAHAAVVALVAKMARVVWALQHHRRDYEVAPAAA